MVRKTEAKANEKVKRTNTRVANKSSKDIDEFLNSGYLPEIPSESKKETKPVPKQKAATKRPETKRSAATKEKPARRPAIKITESEDVFKNVPLHSINLRHYQDDSIKAFDSGKKRQMLIWHRRAGKDAYGMQVARQQVIKEPATYWHLFPAHAQAKRAIWTGIDARQKKKFVDIAFGDLYQPKNKNNVDMFIEMDNGATWQMLGSDNYDRHIGSNPKGVIFSEWALCNPQAWEYIRPILRENDGWALFITTYRGRNHAYKMYQTLKDNENWYTDLRTINDTFRNDGLPVVSEEDVEEDRREGMSEATIQQEYYCNPTTAREGAIYGAPMEYITKDKRITDIKYNPSKPVYAFWTFKFFPMSISVILSQPNNEAGSNLLFEDTYYFEDLSNAFSQLLSSTAYPIAKHVFYETDECPSVIEDATEFGFNADILTPYEDGDTKIITAKWLRNSYINKSLELTQDSLNGYRVREEYELEEYRGYDPKSFEQYLVSCCEANAVYMKTFQTNQWLKGRNYKASTRATI